MHRLQTLELEYGLKSDFLLMYRHIALNARFKDLRTRVYLRTRVLLHPQAVNVKLIRSVHQLDFVPLARGSCIVPAVDNMTITYTGKNLTEATLVGFTFGGCHLRRIEEGDQVGHEDQAEDENEENEEKYIWRTYELVWPGEGADV